MTGAATTQCGFVALIGMPNAGKSCLLNALVGEKVSIVSPKVQTTRTRVTGILTREHAQAVFIDTPGIFKPRRRLDRAMVAAAHDARDSADILAIVADVTRKDCAQSVSKLLGRLPAHERGRKIILVLTKIDLVARTSLLPLIQKLSETHEFERVFMVSSTKDDGVKDLRDWILGSLPAGPFHYDPEQLSDQPDAILAAEITREKFFHRLHEELPYGLHVETSSFEASEKEIELHQDVIIAEDRHKGMVIGKGGSMLKLIGQMAREEMEQIFGRRVHLFLQVVVRKNWDEKTETLYGMGLDPSA